MRKVPDALEAREHRALEKRHRLDAVRDWNQGIPIAPEDRDGRQRGDLVRAVPGVELNFARMAISSSVNAPPAARSARVVPNAMKGWPKRSTKSGKDAHRSETATSRPSPPADTRP